jgi:hypothetical protein
MAFVDALRTTTTGDSSSSSKREKGALVGYMRTCASDDILVFSPLVTRAWLFLEEKFLHPKNTPARRTL